MLPRRSILALPALATLPALAQGAWPERPVRIVVPYPPGGSTDVLTRIIGEALKGPLPGATFVIENRSGAGGNIGADAVAKAAPDGYTFVSAPVGIFSINQYLYSRMSYDAEKDLLPISLTYELPNVAVIPASLPPKTLAEFIAWAKARPDGIAYGSPGVGTTPHLSGELFRVRTGISATHVPFRGAAQTIPAMLSGDVHFAIDNLASYISAIQAGQLRALAITSADRWPTMKEVPTMAEAGMDDFVVTSWTIMAAPAGTPRPIIDRFSAALQALARDPAHQQRFLTAGGRALGSTPEEAAAFAAKERARWREVVRISGARAD